MGSDITPELQSEKLLNGQGVGHIYYQIALHCHLPGKQKRKKHKLNAYYVFLDIQRLM